MSSRRGSSGFRGRGRGRGGGGGTYRSRFSGGSGFSKRGGRGGNSRGGNLRGQHNPDADEGAGAGQNLFERAREQQKQSNGNGGGSGTWRDRKAVTTIEDPALEARFGYEVMRSGTQLGFLTNIQPGSYVDEEAGGITLSVLDMYFLRQDGTTFKAQLPFQPYFYLAVRPGFHNEVASYLQRRFEDELASVTAVTKEDLDLKNHLTGLKATYLQLRFRSVRELISVRKALAPEVKRNQERAGLQDAYGTSAEDALIQQQQQEQALMLGGSSADSARAAARASAKASMVGTTVDYSSYLTDMREYDIPYYMRVSIDADVRVGYWYDVSVDNGAASVRRRQEIVTRGEPRVVAFDIETCKMPLKFPDPQSDPIMMISYMIDRQGYLIVNRAVVSEDIEDFEYTPKPDYPGPFIVMNEPDEKALLRRWFDHMQQVRPGIYVTFNGDFFDWPYIEARASHHGLNMPKEIGVGCDAAGEYKSRFASHLDAFRWVKRDSYLPQGSQGLKAVTKAKLGYDPLELNPEVMTPYARDRPQTLASYSVSDAVATYYLYMKYVHPFIFSLCNIIPMHPDDVLRKGSGTLCEYLLVVQAFQGNIIAPNKHQQLGHAFHDAKLIESETYIGGHVEALRSGVFRSDFPVQFKCEPEAYQQLIGMLDETIEFGLKEAGVTADQITNVPAVKAEIQTALERLRDEPKPLMEPLIYHVDVSAMYPNIILTNRLQPSSIVTPADCAACDYNTPESDCKREMQWIWRGELLPANMAEYRSVRRQLEAERFPNPRAGSTADAETVSFVELGTREQEALIMKRMQEYSRTVYKRTHDTVHETRDATVCQRENPFYVDTVRMFRDRRYVYKGELKKAKRALASVETSSPAGSLPVQQAKDLVVLYDSLQLAHKCILNSFYGYVMRRGARWYSMEMAGVVTHTGANIIKMANEWVCRLGLPLELDTDGIWCMLPRSFPENFSLETVAGKKITLSYLPTMLNRLVEQSFANHQYQVLPEGAPFGAYEKSSECSIVFELDGPYKAMVLPSAKEEGKKLKKRYAVFNDDNTLAELKGFEIKRRGELRIIKIFQSQVFSAFLEGDNLQSCYDAVARVANHWLDVLFSRGVGIETHELMELINESRNMSQRLEDYGDRKSTAINTARRLAEFLGAEMVKDAGLACSFIIARSPAGAPVTERAIPTAIFDAEESVRQHYLRRWCKDASMTKFDVRDVLDWPYYIGRLGSAIMKIITIPAALQGIANPVPRVAHPDWLQKAVREQNSAHRQTKLDEMFAGAERRDMFQVDIEDIGRAATSSSLIARTAAAVTVAKRGKSRRTAVPDLTRLPDAEKDEIRAAAPDIDTDFDAWLQHSKRKWRLRVQERRARRAAGQIGPATLQHREPAGTLGALVHSATARLSTDPWQVLQLCPDTSRPGTMMAWVLQGRSICQVELRIPRILYINARTGVSMPAFAQQVNMHLPVGHTPYSVYELRLPEPRYQAAGLQLNALFEDRDVEGVFERGVPLLFRALMHLGCVAGVRPEWRLHDPDHGYDMDQMQRNDVLADQYLRHWHLRFGYVYHALDARTGLGVLAVVVPTSMLADGGSDAPGPFTGHVWFIARSGVDVPNMQRVYAEVKQQRAADAANAEEPEPPEVAEWRVHTVRDAAAAMSAAQRRVQAFHGTPALLVVQQCGGADLPVTAWQSMFPVVQIPGNESDARLRMGDWQRHLAGRVVTRFADAMPWLQDMCEFARYARLPIGNLVGDVALLGSDVMFARHLHQNQHVLWIGDEACDAQTGLLHGTEDIIVDKDVFAAIETNNSGAYYSMCVKLKLEVLAVNAVMQLQRIGELETSSAAVGVQTAVKVLHSLLQRWMIVDLANETYRGYADNLLMHFFRWIRSPQSLMYSADVHAAVQGMMRKMFLQLLAQLRRYGCTPVYANFHTIILATGKQTLAAATNYVDFLLNTINQQPMFEFLQLTPLEYWQALLWKDRANWAGISALEHEIPLPALAATPRPRRTASPVVTDAAGRVADARSPKRQRFLDLSDASDDEDDATGKPGMTQEQRASVLIQAIESAGLPSIVSSWNISSYLPDRHVAEAFVAIVSEFMFRVWCREHAEARDAPHRLALQQGDAALGRVVDDDNALRGGAAGEMMFDQETSAMAKYIQGVFDTRLAPRLFEMVRAIQEHHRGSASVTRSAGGHSRRVRLDNPALEFVKSVAYIMSLDPRAQRPVALLKRNLLLLIGVREYAPEAEFRDPCRTLVLPDVVCAHCSDCRDLDLVREGIAASSEDAAAWRCVQCRSAYDRIELEQRLIHLVHTVLRNWQVQDLRCLKCQKIKQANMAVRCPCSGEYETLMLRSVVDRTLATLHEVAETHQLPLLSETVEWLMSH